MWNEIPPRAKPYDIYAGPLNMRKAAAVKWYEIRWITQEKAAEIAGVSRSEFLRVLHQFQVSPFQYTEDEIEQELGNYA